MIAAMMRWEWEAVRVGVKFGDYVAFIQGRAVGAHAPTYHV
jgi:hypothetical protein